METIPITTSLTTGSLVCIIICIAALAAIVADFVIKRIRFSRKGWLAYVSTIKKGHFLYIYAAAIPMYLANRADGITDANSFFKAFFESLGHAASLIGLKFDAEDIEPLIDNNILYQVVVYVCFGLVVINAMMFLFSLFHRGIHRLITNIKWQMSVNKVLIIGNNPDSINILRSVNPDNGEKCIIVDRLTRDEENELYVSEVPYANTEKMYRKDSKSGTLIEKLIGGAIRGNQKRFEGEDCRLSREMYRIIINTESDERNLKICRELCSEITTYIDEVRKNYGEEDQHRIITDLFLHVQANVFGNPQYEALYLEVVKEASGVIRYINKYTQVAIDFIDRYPLTQFMTDEQIDTERFVLRDDVNVNVLMIGFGTTNQQIFLTSVANNQFLKIEKDENGKDTESLKPVRYHIFDRDCAEKNKNLNHGYYRYRNEFFTEETLEKMKSDSICSDSQTRSYVYPVSYPYGNDIILPEKVGKYLPLPMIPAEEYYHHLDINDSLFYSSMRQILLEGRNNISYITVAFGTDLENIDLARKIIEKRDEWGIDNVYVFVKVRSGASTSSIFSDSNKCFIIGDEKTAVYDLEKIKCSEIMSMALRRNDVYESVKAKKTQEEIDNLYKWYAVRTQIERDSNFYAILSLRSKLHMMGMDYVDSGDNKVAAIKKDEYLNIYAKDDYPVKNAKGKIEYPNPYDFKKSGRRTMAVQEHYRWNSYMISQGIIPSTIDQIKNDGYDGKNYAERRHGNLTTFDGLLEFYEMVGYDVIQYDYQLLDDVYEILPAGKKIVRKEGF